MKNSDTFIPSGKLGRPGKCKTKKGKTCQFPFIYEKKRYDKCINEDEKFWCSTKVNAANEHVKGEFGWCAKGCPLQKGKNSYFIPQYLQIRILIYSLNHILIMKHLTIKHTNAINDAMSHTFSQAANYAARVTRSSGSFMNGTNITEVVTGN